MSNQIVGLELKKEEFPLKLSKSAEMMALRATMGNENSKEMFLRVSIRGGGCAGMKYNLDIDDVMSKHDVYCRFNDLKVVSDIFSLQYLKDTLVDYQETLDGAGFKFENPNARKTCGCGSSFSG